MCGNDIVGGGGVGFNNTKPSSERSLKHFAMLKIFKFEACFKSIVFLLTLCGHNILEYERSKGEGKGKEEERKGRGEKGKGKLEVKLWQKGKKSQTPQPRIEPGTPVNAADALAGAFAIFPFLPKLH